jgi:osmoprotectant transport system permease protein
MTKSDRKIHWHDFVLPVLIVVVFFVWGYYCLHYPTDKFVSTYLTLSQLKKSVKEQLLIIILSSTYAIATAVPLGVLLTRPKLKRFGNAVISVISVIQTIPSFAIIALSVAYLGIGVKTAIFALWLHSLLPILHNTIAAINGVNPAVQDAARGMGMSKFRILFLIELPLAMPVIMAGIRTAVVITAGSAMIATWVGGGGLGDIILAGKNLSRWMVLGIGAGYASLIALFFDHMFSVIEKAFTN